MGCIRHSAPAGQIIGRLIGHDKESGRVLGEYDLVTCAHCGYLWAWIPGSGKRRGWCMTCHGLLCGHAACSARPCRHWQQWFDNREHGLPDDHKPIQILVPGGVPAAS